MSDDGPPSSLFVPPGDQRLHEEQGRFNWYEQDVGKETEIIII